LGNPAAYKQQLPPQCPIPILTCHTLSPKLHENKLPLCPGTDLCHPSIGQLHEYMHLKDLYRSGRIVLDWDSLLHIFFNCLVTHVLIHLTPTSLVALQLGSMPSGVWEHVSREDSLPKHDVTCMMRGLNPTPK